MISHRFLFLETAMSNDKVKDHGGEGDREAARRYNQETTEFARQHDTEALAEDAAPDSASEARALKQAEQAGEVRAREKDPQAKRD